eukprot:Gb_17102 [translate_table: standard]
MLDLLCFIVRKVIILVPIKGRSPQVLKSKLLFTASQSGREVIGGEGDNDTERSGLRVETIHIRCINSSKFSVDAEFGFTVGAFKVLLAEKFDISADQQRVIFKGRILKDDSLLESYGNGNRGTAGNGKVVWAAVGTFFLDVSTLPLTDRNAGMGDRQEWRGDRKKMKSLSVAIIATCNGLVKD